MPRLLPANSGRVQGRLYRSRQLSGSSAILEVPCRSSANCVIKPATANTGNAGIVAAPCCRPGTKAQLDALRNTFVRDATVAKMFSKMSWLLVGSAITGVTGEKCRRHRKTIRDWYATGFPRGVGSFEQGYGLVGERYVQVHFCSPLGRFAAGRCSGNDGTQSAIQLPFCDGLLPTPCGNHLPVQERQSCRSAHRCEC